MNRVDVEIFNINAVICKNIDKFDSTERGFLSQNILSQLRNFVEHVSLKAYSNGRDIENTYDNIKSAITHVKRMGNLNFLAKFHKFLQITTSHYTLDEEASERLMLKYYEYLLKIKTYLKNVYNVDVLENINEFPINLNPALKEYYEKIAIKIDLLKTIENKDGTDDRYYIQKIKPFFINYNVYYEVTFTLANDKSSKFDRIIAFTKLDILHNYAVKLSIKKDKINIFDKDMPIQIIDGWEVSIRSCEFKNLSKILGDHSGKQGGGVEYRELMKFLFETGLNLVEVIDFCDNLYSSIKRRIIQPAKATHIFDILDKCRELIKNEQPGSNVVRYLLYRLNNKIMKKQYESSSCEKLSNLNLKYGCIPFDQMPYNFSLINHNPKLSDLLYSIDPSTRNHEIFARFVKNTIENKGELYIYKKDIERFDNIDELMLQYNNNLYHKHINCKLEDYKGAIYIKAYEENTLYIIKKLKDLSSSGINNYAHSVDSWLRTSSYYIDCDEKKKTLRQMFESSKVALIYGAAGTGKTTMINHVSHFFYDKKKLYLTNTNPAIDNLRRKVNAPSCTFKTIAKFLSPKNHDKECDLLVIDECSTVSNSDMCRILQQASFKLLILVGDIFQIESIIFGNWFSIVPSFIAKTPIFDLVKPYRSNDTSLLGLWKKVRNVDDGILECIAKNKYSTTLDESIFECSGADEIILCLNYDGLYGINNINRFLQNNNKNDPIEWGIHTYKINDPILFNESERFAPLIYNNLKGKIVGIEKFKDKIQFDIELSNKTINQLDADGYEFYLMPNSEDGNSVIRFFVSKHRSTDDDDDDFSNVVIPFQIAYAVSIHKAQGLEYDSVKLVIADEIEEMITHNIFYTAITRAKNKLKIYWAPEVENKILSNLKKKINNKKDIALLSTRLIF